MNGRGTLGPALERIRGGRSLALLAEDTGFDVDDLVDIEHGRWHPPLGVLREIADALELGLLERRELQEEHRITEARMRANPWMRQHQGRRRAS